MYDLTTYPVKIVAIVLAMTVHAFTTALVAVKLGDNTPKMQGRLTLNPFKQIEIIGFLLMLFFGYGWCQPVYVNPMQFDNEKRRNSILLTCLTPVVVNLLLGVLLGIGARVLHGAILTASATGSLAWWGYLLLLLAARYNVSMAVFSLIPVYPMVGAKVLGLYLSPNARVKFSNNEKIFQMILVMLLILNILQRVLDPICNLILGFAY